MAPKKNVGALCNTKRGIRSAPTGKPHLQSPGADWGGNELDTVIAHAEGSRCSDACRLKVAGIIALPVKAVPRCTTLCRGGVCSSRRGGAHGVRYASFLHLSSFPFLATPSETSPGMHQDIHLSVAAQGELKGSPLCSILIEMPVLWIP